MIFLADFLFWQIIFDINFFTENFLTNFLENFWEFLDFFLTESDNSFIEFFLIFFGTDRIFLLKYQLFSKVLLENFLMEFFWHFLKFFGKIFTGLFSALAEFFNQILRLFSRISWYFFWQKFFWTIFYRKIFWNFSRQFCLSDSLLSEHFLDIFWQKLFDRFFLHNFFEFFYFFQKKNLPDFFDTPIFFDQNSLGPIFNGIFLKNFFDTNFSQILTVFLPNFYIFQELLDIFWQSFWNNFFDKFLW